MPGERETAAGPLAAAPAGTPVGAGQAYALPLELVLRVLGSHQHTSHLRADVPAVALPMLKGAGPRGATYQVQVQVAQGQVHSCEIRDRHGRVLLAGQEALEAVRANDQVIWMLQGVQAPEEAGLGGMAGAHNGSIYGGQALEPPETLPLALLPWTHRPAPRLTRPLTAQVIAAVSRKHRVMLLLIDGRRQATDLAALLRWPWSDVVRVLEELVGDDLITL